MNQRRRRVPLILLAIFFGAGALICLVTMLALAFPGGILEPIWRLRPDARFEFQKFGNWSVLLMATVGIACGLASFGLARRAEWGRRLAIGILAVNLIGDSLNAFLRHDPRTLIGLPIGGIMIWYLLRAKEHCQVPNESQRGELVASENATANFRRSSSASSETAQ